jgi:hypothetical protein
MESVADMRADDAPGESLRTLARGDNRDRVGFSEYHDGGSPTASYALRFDRWKYICHYGERPELYDMVDDPDELFESLSIQERPTKRRSSPSGPSSRSLAVVRRCRDTSRSTPPRLHREPVGTGVR